MGTKVRFKVGNEDSLSGTTHRAGTVYFARDDDNENTKVYYDTGSEFLNVVPEVLDCGPWSIATVQTASVMTLRNDSTTCCFVPGTKILVDFYGNQKNIEDIIAGEAVVAYDTTDDSFYLAQVEQLIIKEDTTDIATVIFESGRFIEMNAYHPLYTEDGFHSLTNYNNYPTLEVGDKVRTTEGWDTIEYINRVQLSTPMTTYNLAVKNFDEIIDIDTNDTFIANGFVVHNTTTCAT